MTGLKFTASVDSAGPVVLLVAVIKKKNSSIFEDVIRFTKCESGSIPSSGLVMQITLSLGAGVGGGRGRGPWGRQLGVH